MTVRICLETATESFEECAEYADQGYETCDRWEDQGYSSCSQWDERCCTWWPCSWGCKLITAVCVATVWVTNMVCVAWIWVSNVVCIAWNVVTTVVCAVWGVIQLALLPIALLWELIESIPVVGRIIDMIANLIQTIHWRLSGLAGIILDVVGIRPLKKLDLCIIILRNDAGPVATPASLAPAIASATQILRDEANIHMHVSGIHTVDGVSPDYVLNVGCNLDAVGEDLTLAGSWFSLMAARYCTFGAASRVFGYRKQLIAFCVDDIPGGTAGCALGPLNDYLTIEGGNPVCLAHEIGHKLGLWHCCPGTNLANGICGGTQMDWWQVAIARNAKYVSYI